MARYQYAKDDQGNIVKATDLVGQEISTNFFCFGCGNLLIAKVNGKIYTPHFAHKNIQECQGETYLHYLGKQVFFETYTKCLTENIPYYVEFEIPKKCHKYKRAIRKYCNLGFVKKKFDLTEYYSQIEIEKRNEEFIPDILLSRRFSSEDNIYIEIAVTHFLSEKKKKSGKRIIEIPLNSEDDVEKIYKSCLSPSDALFKGFYQGVEVVPEAECRCMRKQFFAFYVWESGKAFLELTYLSEIEGRLLRFKNKIIYNNIIEIDSDFENSTVNFGHAHGDLFISQVRLAASKKISIRNCFLCKYSGENWNGDSNQPIFCKAKKIKCGSNQAAECNWYKLATNSIL
ncbi:Competence protein CoiA-like family protein [Acinetobacter marinus]|uniref:Competence protein CoiA-like family protein n=1 Tax=Acinetobacter marinus TaxID=281375 RepID=A0A1G6J637_9GAMM|nr:competence protein CoiA family protein [Acinetobacter marinus]SDC13396.1 Competence protein CoiA-like family protein [Acinetobacter marinus]